MKGHSGNRFLQIPQSWEEQNPEQCNILKHMAFASFTERCPSYVARAPPNPQSLFPEMERIRENVIRVLSFPEVSPSGKQEMIKEFDFTHNLVTDNGDIYYAKKGAGESPAANENFLQARMELRNMADTPAKADNYGQVLGPITASRKTISGTYPKTNDTGDTDNTGDAVDAVSYSYSWTTSDFNDTAIQGGCQHDNATPVSGTKLLNHFSIASFAKSASDTLKMFTNHTFTGS